MMVKAVLVDDEMLVLQLLERVISQFQDINIIGAFTDPEVALVEIPKLEPDVLFLDVDMPEINGIELGTRLLESVENEEMAIVFVTAFEQYAIHAFKLNAIHYILKPVDTQSVEEVMMRLYEKRGIQRTENRNDGEINLFGHMHLRVNGKLIKLLTAKSEELLALLIMHREKGISKWLIIDCLWESSTMEKSQQNLYTSVFRLKKMLQHAGMKVKIELKNNVYRINLQHVTCDIIEFGKFMEEKRTINEQNIIEFEKAISLYQGDLLYGKDFLWCIHHRERYYQQFVDLVMVVATYYEKNKQMEDLKKLYYNVKHRLIEEDHHLMKIGYPN